MLHDAVLDRRAADMGAGIRASHRVSVADAHLGAVIRTADEEQITVLTSDPGDVRLVAGPRPVAIVAI